MYKKSILIVVAGLFLSLGSCKKPVAHGAAGTPPIMTFKETTYDFGAIDQGDVVTHNFEFTNTGGTDLIISDAVGSCGCTIPKFPKAPVAPGDSEEMKVKFNSEGKSGRVTKTVTISSNTDSGTEILTIKATINSNPGK